jgi:hypothetical protein
MSPRGNGPEIIALKQLLKMSPAGEYIVHLLLNIVRLCVPDLHI